ncbi:MAG: type II toxin-antitoxin system VapC family toxin [Spirochaetes bacterium]|nr:type II toxin-antitoxin system VapC family toxin [Spirochaetota bacterium]
MAIKVFDTNAIIYLSKGLLDIDSVIDDTADYAISVITYMEVLGYDFSSIAEEKFVRKLLSYFRIIYIDKEICNTVIRLRKKYKIKLPDAIICATTIVFNATLVTNDFRLKSIKNLKLQLLNI